MKNENAKGIVIKKKENKTKPKPKHNSSKPHRFEMRN